MIRFFHTKSGVPVVVKENLYTPKGGFGGPPTKKRKRPLGINLTASPFQVNHPHAAHLNSLSQKLRSAN